MDTAWFDRGDSQKQPCFFIDVGSFTSGPTPSMPIDFAGSNKARAVRIIKLLISPRVEGGNGSLRGRVKSCWRKQNENTYVLDKVESEIAVWDSRAIVRGTEP